MTSDESDTADGPLNAVVQLAFYRLTTADESSLRWRRLLVHRHVAGRCDSAEAAVEGLWVGSPCGSAAELVDAVRALTPDAAAPLLCGRAPGQLPGLAKANLGTVVAVADSLGQADVEELLIYRATVPDLDSALVVPAGVALDVPYRTTTALAVLDVMRRTLRRLGMTDEEPPPDADASSAAPDATETSAVDPRVTVRGFLDRTVTALAREQQIDDAHSSTPLQSVPQWDSMPAHSIAQQPLGWVREADAAPEGLDDPGRVLVTFVDVDGLQVGADNKQTNLITYRMRPNLDLDAALSDPAVRAAFTAYATSTPETFAASRRAAIEALRGVHTGQRTDFTDAERSTPRSWFASRIDRRIEGLGGTIIIQDCRHVQVGERMRQYTKVGYTVSPTVDAADLLRRHPAIVESIVDHVCRSTGPGERQLRERLSEAVGGMAEGAYGRPPGEGIVPARNATVTGNGLTFGPRARQDDHIRVIPELDAAVHRALALQREEAESRLRVEEARRAQQLAEVTRVDNLADLNCAPSADASVRSVPNPSRLSSRAPDRIPNPASLPGFGGFG